jgi:hypothetical protein
MIYLVSLKAEYDIIIIALIALASGCVSANVPRQSFGVRVRPVTSQALLYYILSVRSILRIGDPYVILYVSSCNMRIETHTRYKSTWTNAM